MWKPSVVALALLATPAVAQDFGPEGYDFVITGTNGGEVIAQDRAGRNFVCEVDEFGAGAVITQCIPLRYMSQGDMQRLMREQEALADSLRNMPEAGAALLVANVLTDLGCSIKIASEDEAMALLIPAMAPHVGFAPDEVTDDLVDALENVLEDGGQALEEQGRLQIDEDAATVTLTDCG